MPPAMVAGWGKSGERSVPPAVVAGWGKGQVREWYRQPPLRDRGRERESVWVPPTVAAGQGQDPASSKGGIGLF